MTEKILVEKTVSFVKETLKEAEGGHDWWHIYRVWKTAQHISEKEGGVDCLVVELGALLHDIADSKFHNGDEEVGPRLANEFLQSIDLAPETIEQVTNIVRHIGFKKNLDGQAWTSPELAVVQDADRLDAIGAIGIVRAFNYGGHINATIYNPEIKPNPNLTKEERKREESPTINHFAEKLFLLKDLMNTKTGKAMAKERHQFMENFLDQFYAEWEGGA